LGGDAATGSDEFDAHSDAIVDSASAFQTIEADAVGSDQTARNASAASSVLPPIARVR